MILGGMSAGTLHDHCDNDGDNDNDNNSRQPRRPKGTSYRYDDGEFTWKLWCITSLTLMILKRIEGQEAQAFQ